MLDFYQLQCEFYSLLFWHKGAFEFLLPPRLLVSLVPVLLRSSWQVHAPYAILQVQRFRVVCWGVQIRSTVFPPLFLCTPSISLLSILCFTSVLYPPNSSMAKMSWFPPLIISFHKKIDEQWECWTLCAIKFEGTYRGGEGTTPVTTACPEDRWR